ncbi:response regulator transcription factor [Hathewaya massiliensis]|uniref:response regulator transcription factor n=1 Tax=Hathewaya massiliensis TaxID=1964382 RepID=UPI0011588368|nr:response regulator transcription factor [Hathewaya massiliensis]
MYKILIVEDDLNISKLINVTLRMAGYITEKCFDGKTALKMIMENNYDVVLLDIMLPHMDGFEIMEKMELKNTAVIFLTAKGDVADRVKGLRLGADDYIIKPFESIELIARVEAVLRRIGKEKTVFQYEDIEINIAEHQVRKAGTIIDLTPKEFELIVLFIKNIDIALSREKLLSIIWGFSYQVETRTVDYHVQQLRKKLNLKDKLKTVTKIGYRLES